MRMRRRTFLKSSAAQLFGAPAAMFVRVQRGPAQRLPPGRTRLAICSETFTGSSFAEACKAAWRTGYAGIEIEPAHLGPDPATLSAAQRLEVRRIIEGEGLRYVGLHSFLKTPAGLHLTAANSSLRRRSWDYLARLVDLAADLGDRPVMVLGSSKQRQAIEGTKPQEAVKLLTDGLRKMAPLAEKRGVCILMEPLAPQLCNVVNTLEEAAAIVRAVGSSAVQTIFDSHNTAAEKKPLDALLREYFPLIRHVHLNEMDGQRPGAGTFPFALVLGTLKQLRYSGWISVEVFHFKPDGETVARLAGEFLYRLEEKVP
jgi:sugar phosphate isomerase/epimerase